LHKGDVDTLTTLGSDLHWALSAMNFEVEGGLEWVEGLGGVIEGLVGRVVGR
jgi:hypothetical protein